MPAGEHYLPFSFSLPPNLPPSFEGDYGYIRYWAKATIDRPWKFDHHTKRAFSVISCLDLNQEPTAPVGLFLQRFLVGVLSGRLTTTPKGFSVISSLNLNQEPTAPVSLRLLLVSKHGA